MALSDAARTGESQGLLSKVGMMLEMIKVEHTLFAAPFCLSSLLVATGGKPSLRLLILVVVALTSARAAAMGFNRVVDADIDAKNERTKKRHIPAGQITRLGAGLFVIICVALFICATALLNDLAFMLSPLALVVVLGYSFTKRFTSLSHVVLGMALSIAPVGAWIAARSEFAPPPIILAAAVVCWVAGFDVIYACQDTDFDRKVGLRSVPASIGIRASLVLSRVLHVGAAGLLVWFGLEAGLGVAYLAGVALTVLLLAYEHTLVKADDLSRVNVAFFTVNGAISMLLLVATAVDIYALRGAAEFAMS